MDSNNEYTHNGFWSDMSITIPPSFNYPDKLKVKQLVSHATYSFDMSITLVKDTLPF